MDTTALCLYTKSTAISIHQFDASHKMIFSTLDKMTEHQKLITLPVYAKLIKDQSHPVIQYVSDTEYYGHFYYENSYFIIGPILNHPILTLKDRYHLSFYASLSKTEWQMRAHQIPIMSTEAFSTHLKLIYYLVTAKEAKKIEIPAVSNIPATILINEDASYESALMHLREAIKNRDFSAVEAITARSWHGYLRLLSLDSFFQSMYLFVCLLTYCVTYAVNLGANFHDAIALIDAYILQADQERDRRTLLKHFEQFMYDLIELMPSPEYSHEIRLCLDYIHHHLDENLNTETLSKISHLSRAYLCTRFKAETGETIADYILKRRIEIAKKELGQSHEPIVNIAEKLGFKSQSHFTSQFKKQTKMTPKIWRQTYYSGL